MIYRNSLGDHTAHRKTNDRRTRESEIVEQADNLLDEIAQASLAGRIGTTAMAKHVVADYSPMSRQRRDLSVSHSKVDTNAVNQQHRRPRSG